MLESREGVMTSCSMSCAVSSQIGSDHIVPNELFGRHLVVLCPISNLSITMYFTPLPASAISLFVPAFNTKKYTHTHTHVRTKKNLSVSMSGGGDQVSLRPVYNVHYVGKMSGFSQRASNRGPPRTSPAASISQMGLYFIHMTHCIQV